jgi:hypothetical protein
VIAALDFSRSLCGIEEGTVDPARLLDASPWLVDVPPSILLRAAWQVAGHGDLRLSLGQREQLETACQQLERTGIGVFAPGRRAAVAAVLWLAWGEWRSFWHVRKSEHGVRTPGALAICARRLAHRELAAWRSRRDPDRAKRAAANRAGRKPAPPSVSGVLAEVADV